MALSIGLMSIFVFGNVILRYVFNSGLTWSEELARFLFVWMTFLGAIGALKDNKHLGVDLLLRKLPPNLYKLIYVIGQIVILFLLLIILHGSWKMTLLNVNNYSPAIGLPLSSIFLVGIVMSVCMWAIVIYRTYCVWFKKEQSNEIGKSTEFEVFVKQRGNKK